MTEIDVDEVRVPPVPEPDVPDEGVLDPDDDYTEGKSEGPGMHAGGELNPWTSVGHTATAPGEPGPSSEDNDTR